MILTDREIKNSLEYGLIVIDPSPAQDAYASTSVDLTLARSLRVSRKSKQVWIRSLTLGPRDIA